MVGTCAPVSAVSSDCLLQALLPGSGVGYVGDAETWPDRGGGEQAPGAELPGALDSRPSPYPDGVGPLAAEWALSLRPFSIWTWPARQLVSVW